MSVWTHTGAGGEDYPVQPGDVWYIGRHTFVCSDLIESSVFRDVLSRETVDLVYCDPPWNEALLSGFRTRAGLQKPKYGVELLYQAITRLVPDAPLYIEGSLGEESWMTQVLPGPYTERFEVTYFGGKPSLVLYSGASPEPVNVSGLAGTQIPEAVMRGHGTGTVVDPCGGLGLIARSAELTGWASVTNELSPWRMSAAMASVQKMVKGEVEKA